MKVSVVFLIIHKATKKQYILPNQALRDCVSRVALWQITVSQKFINIIFNK